MATKKKKTKSDRRPKNADLKELLAYVRKQMEYLQSDMDCAGHTTLNEHLHRNAFQKNLALRQIESKIESMLEDRS